MSANPSPSNSPVAAPNLVAEKRMTLTAITKGRRPAPDRILLVGVEGVGKSTFGAGAPDPVFLAAEDGIRQLDVAAFPEPRTLEDVYAALAELTTGAHSYKTLVIDTIDWLEPLVFKAVCRRDGVGQIEQVGGGYGKGYAVTVDEWRTILSKLDRLRLARNMEIILLAHSLISTFQNPAGPDFSRYEVAINKKGAGVIKQWTDVNLFATFEEFTAEAGSGNLVGGIASKKKVKGISSGRRVVHTERTAAWDAKNRYGLAPTLALDYAEYAAAREAGLQMDVEAAAAEAIGIIEKLGLGEAAKAHVEKLKGNPAELRQGLNRLRTKAADAGVE